MIISDGNQAIAIQWDEDKARAAYYDAMENGDSQWVAAHGTAQPFCYRGEPWLQVYNPAAEEYAWLNLRTDAVVSDYRCDGSSRDNGYAYRFAV